MPLQFYKPNKFKTGSAGSFTINSKGGAIYAEIVKQLTWDDKTETATFYDKEKKEKGPNVKIQLDRDEIGGLIYSLLTKGEFKAYHESETQTTQIEFKQYQKYNKQTREYEGPFLGWGLTVSRKSKEDNGKAESHKLPFTYGEAMVLLEYFRFALEKIFSAIYAEDKQKALEFQEKRKSQQKE